jgi:hypothetical protein
METTFRCSHATPTVAIPARSHTFAHGAVSVQEWSADPQKLLVLAFAEKPDAGTAVVSDYLPYKMEGSGYIAGEVVALYEVDENNGTAHRIPTPGADVKEALLGHRCGPSAHQ